MLGEHNVNNALAAIAAARHVGVTIENACESLFEFTGIKRRMEVRGVVSGITVYDDFAHHPTAIETTINGLRNKVGEQRIIAILEPRSNTMRMGVHANTLATSLAQADMVFIYQPSDIEWSLKDVANQIDTPAYLMDNTAAIIESVAEQATPGDHILVMSNGGFDNLHEKLINRLQLLHEQKATQAKK
jgi:UDP-N-acetylmuramate: L-alanyl-gamma-D-glutamyl-meso-diaminopimelate ligase